MGMKMPESLQFFKNLPGRGGGLHFESDYDVINGPQLKSFPAEIRGEAATLEIAANNSRLKLVLTSSVIY
jgi:hypothetical protein